jgi:hypothetical protein
MSNYVQIYGSHCEIPDVKDAPYIEDWGTTIPAQQYWRRKELPEYFMAVEYNKEGDALLTPQQRQYAMEEVRRCREGFWFLNAGFETYITGKNYFYLQHWKLEDDIYPDYRDSDRRYFLFLDKWEKTPWCLGIIRGKPRRAGATSQATSNLIYECIFFKNSVCGLVSKSNTDARSAFTNMVAFGYRQLPVFLKPKQLNNKDSITELVFAHKSTTVKDGKGRVIDADTGHRSKIDYRAPATNAYDSGRLSRLLADEMGKWSSEVPASKFWAIVSKTMVKGVKRVGFAEFPSTVNEMTKGGGAEYKKIWDSGNQFEHPRTPNRLVRYFCPAYDGYYGFIDRHGNSVINAPTQEQYDYLVANYAGIGDLSEEDIKLGAKEYLLSRRAPLQGSERQEEIRMNPFDEREMFLSSSANCHFDAVLLGELYDRAKGMEKEILEYGNFVWQDNIPFTKAVWEPCSKESSRWVKPKSYKLPEGDTVLQVGNYYHPQNKIQFACGCDPFQNSITESGKGSKACSMVLNRFENGDNAPIFNRMFVLVYHARPPMAEMLHMDMALQCFAMGCMILIEGKQDGGLRDYFMNKGLGGFLVFLPGRANAGVDPNPDNKTLLLNAWEHYILTEGRQGKLIYKAIIDDEHKEGDGLIDFDIQETEPSDLVMGGGWTLVHDYFMKSNVRQKAAPKELTEYFSVR